MVLLLITTSLVRHISSASFLADHDQPTMVVDRLLWSLLCIVAAVMVVVAYDVIDFPLFIYFSRPRFFFVITFKSLACQTEEIYRLIVVWDEAAHSKRMTNRLLFYLSNTGNNSIASHDVVADCDRDRDYGGDRVMRRGSRCSCKCSIY